MGTSSRASVIINLEQERRRRRGQGPLLRLIGKSSTLGDVMTRALDSAYPEDRRELFMNASRGSYADMIVELYLYFEIENLTKTGVVS